MLIPVKININLVQACILSYAKKNCPYTDYPIVRICAENTSSVSVASGVAESSADVTATHGSPGSQEVAPKKSEFFLACVYLNMAGKNNVDTWLCYGYQLHLTLSSSFSL